MEPLSLVLEETLAGMRVGEVCKLESVPQEMARLPDLPPGVLTYTLSLLSLTRGTQLWQLSPSQALSLARENKERGGELFQEGREREAALCYSRAAKLTAIAAATVTASDGEDPVISSAEQLQVPLWLNLAACQLKMGLESHASSNCSRVLAGDQGNMKALYRRGVARMRLGDLEGAEGDLRRAQGVEPGNRAVQRKLRELETLRQRETAKLSHALQPMS